MKKFEKGFLLLDKKWLLDNQFFRSLSHAEFRIMVYILSSPLTIKHHDARFPGQELFIRLYQENKLLIANVSQNKISDVCRVHRGTVQSALEKFDQFGSLITVSAKDDGVLNNFYIIGFEARLDGEDQKLYFVDSIPLTQGRPMPENIKDYIAKEFMDGGVIYNRKAKETQRTMLEILFGVREQLYKHDLMI